MNCFAYPVVMVGLLYPLTAVAETPSRGMIEIASGQTLHTIHVEIADEPNEQSKGLMFREALEENSGMFFLYPAPRRTAFWMKNTQISLDMLFVDDQGLIVKVAEKTTPFSLKPVASESKIIGVLEIAGGRARQLGIKVGDVMRWEIFSVQKP